MKGLLSIIIVLIFAVSISAQETDAQNLDPKQNNQYSYDSEFGLHLGATTGIGLSYRHWFSDFGAQVTFLPFKANFLEFYSGGFSLLRSVKQTKYVHVYGYLGAHAISIDQEMNYNFGIGPGFSFGKVVCFNIQAGYGIYLNEEDYMLLPTGEIGLYYRF